MVNILLLFFFLFLFYFFARSKPPKKPPPPPPPCLPFDVVREMLIHVPVKSLVRFRCVCRQWRHLINHDADFVRMHRERSPTVPLDGDPDPNIEPARIEGCVGGLLLASVLGCVGYVVNPATRQILQLPSSPDSFSSAGIFFCYVASTDEYKVAHLTSKHRLSLLTLGNMGVVRPHWKDVGIIPNPCNGVQSLRALHAGCAEACFWTWTCKTSGRVDVACLDLQSDTFSVIALPRTSRTRRRKPEENYPVGWENCFSVAFFDDGDAKEQLVVWVLRDFRERIWEKVSICLERGGPLKNHDIRPHSWGKRDDRIWFFDIDSQRNCCYNLNTRTFSFSDYKYPKYTYRSNLVSCNGALKSTTSAPSWLHPLACKLQC